MIFPKLAIHISPFKLSHLANRGHLQFQNLRNTFNNINLGSTVAPNAPSVGGSASGGLGAATGPSTAGGAGGAKWSAGSRAGWTQQSQSRLLTQGNSATSDNQNSKQNEDDEADELPTHSLLTQTLYNKRNGTISSRWQHAQQNHAPSAPPVGLSSAGLQARYKCAFTDQCRQSTQASNTQPPNGQLCVGTVDVTILPDPVSTVLHRARSHPQLQIASSPTLLHRRHSISGYTSSHSAIPIRSRRVSTSDVCSMSVTNRTSPTVSRDRRYSSSASPDIPQIQEATDAGRLLTHSMTATPVNNVPRKLALAPHQYAPGEHAIRPTVEDERWLKHSIQILSSADNQYVSFYRIRKLLDAYVSSTASPSTKVVDHLMWGFLMTKPNFEPIHALLRNYQYLLRTPNFKPSPDTYSIIITALSQRHQNNFLQVGLRKGKLDDAMINQRLNQSLPNLSLAPISSAEDLRVISTLTSEPNFEHAAHLFGTLSKEQIQLLQPAALDALIHSCGIQSAIDNNNNNNCQGQHSSRVDLAAGIFGALDSRGICSAQSYASLIDVFGYSRNLPHAQDIFNDYQKVKSGNKSLQHEHQLVSPDISTLSPAFDIPTKPLRLPESKSMYPSGDALVLLSIMRAYLINGDSISAVTLLEESLMGGLDAAGTLTATKVTSAHILEIITGFIRLGDFVSASKWLRKLFNDEHALYDLDQPSKRIEFLDKIVRASCHPEVVGGGLDVANDAIRVSIEKMNPQLNPNSSITLLHRMRQVLNCYLVRALQHSTLLAKGFRENNASGNAVQTVTDSLEKATSLLGEFTSKRSHILDTQPETSDALLNIQTYGMMENLFNRAIQTCHHIRNEWISEPGPQSKELIESCHTLLVKLMATYSRIPDHRKMEADDADLPHESSSLSGLLTCYQNLISTTGVTDQAQLVGNDIHGLQLQFALKITTPVINNNLSLILASQLVQLYSAYPQASDLLQTTDHWLVMLTVAAILQVQLREGTSLPPLSHKLHCSTDSFLQSLVIDFECSLAAEKVSLDKRDAAIDVQFLARVIEHCNINTCSDGKFQSLLTHLNSQASHSVARSEMRLQHYIQEGRRHAANRFSVLKDQDDSSTTHNANTVQSSQMICASQTTVTPSSTPSPLFSSSPPCESEQSPPGSSSRHFTPVPVNDLENTTSLSTPVVPVPHPPFRSFNENLSQLALSMFCTKDLSELDNMYQAVHNSTATGSYLTPDASSALVETFGRLGQIERMREMYVNAHVGLACIEGDTQSDQATRSASWIRVEDRTIIGLAYCGALDELAIHKLRLIDNGEAPSADAYAAMIQHARETTDDASVALAYFEEAIRHRVRPNTFLCNTIISKLSKARRAPEALQVFDYMKQNNLPRNSVTFGAIINACCKNGDEKSAERLFKEMLRSKYYKPRIPPFNTMIQLYTQGVKQPDREKVLYYFDQMLKQKIPPSDHTYNLLMQAYGYIEPCDPVSMQDVFDRACRDRNVQINGAHWSTLIGVKGCIEKDLEGTLKLFDSIRTHPSTGSSLSGRVAPLILPDAVCYEALFNVLLAFKRIDLVPTYTQRMTSEGVHMTAYVVNTLMKAHASCGDIQAARELFESLVDPAPGQAAAFNHPAQGGAAARSSVQGVAGKVGDPVYREPSSWETMIRAEVGCGAHERAEELIKRMESRAYPSALINRARKLIDSIDTMPHPGRNPESSSPATSRINS